ncbi:unannotated protein [freshwater metagenome]|uniref:Unannotated protein n=1 Tax=freshwater metagenome TaxID=449393 RepID=A0A6J7ULV0_9ZZZZ
MIASALDKPFSEPELINFPSPGVAIPVTAGSSKSLSTTVRIGRFIVLAKSKSR